MREPLIYVFDIECLSSLHADCGSMCCMSYKELNKGKVKTLSLEDYPSTYKKDIFDDSKLVTDVVKVLSKADVLIGHNSKSTAKWGFDIKYINTRIAMNNLDLPPLVGMREIDTFHDIARKHLRFRSNRLTEIAKALGAPEDWVDSKDDMKFPQDWNAFIVKRPGAAKKMRLRNQVDVLITEWVLNRLAKFCVNMPHMGILAGQDKHAYSCPQCGLCDRVNNKDKRKYLDHEAVISTQTALYQRLICRRCNRTFRGRKLGYLDV